MVPCHSSKRMIHTKINHSLFNLWGCLHVATFHCQVWIINCKNLPLTLMLLHIPFASLYPCAPKNCRPLPFWRNQGAQVLTFSIQMWKAHLYQLSLHMASTKTPCPTWVSCRNGRSAVPMVEWAQRWSARQAGRGAFHFGPAKNDLTELVCLEDFVKKNYCPHHFPFWCLASFFHSSKLSCRVCVILHCLL